MRAITAIVISAIVIMAGVLIYHESQVHPPTFKQYNLNIGLNNSTIGSLEINGNTYSNLGGHWFNLTMRGYNNYTVTFPYYVEYNGFVNTTAHVYLQNNTTVKFNPVLIADPIQITTTSPNASLEYQQLININLTRAPFDSQSINTNLSNVEFAYHNGSFIYAWIQNITDKNATVWMKLYQDINQTIYMVVYSQSKNFLSSTGYLGEAPQLTTPYAKYDNGVKVFNQYFNFSGTILPKTITTGGTSPLNYSVNNGFTINPNMTYQASGSFSNESIMGLDAQFFINSSLNIAFDLYIGLPNSYTFKLTQASQKYLHYGGYPYSIFNTPYKCTNSSYSAFFMQIPINLQFSYGYYNQTNLGYFEHSYAPSSIQFQGAVTEDKGISVFQHITYFFIASPIHGGIFPTYQLHSFVYFTDKILLFNPIYIGG